MLTIEDKEFLLLLAKAVNAGSRAADDYLTMAEEKIQAARDHEAWVDNGRQES